MRKRFIAGAVCPKCQSLDTLAVGHENEAEVVVCVKCGYHRRQSEPPKTGVERNAKNIIGIFHPE